MNLSEILNAIINNDIVASLPHFLERLLVTMQVFGCTLLFALPLGLLVCLGRMSKIPVLTHIIQGYLLVMRGTPLILQLIFFYFLPSDLGFPMMPRFWAAVLAFTLNYAAYFAEIYRGGIGSIPKGQYEAANVLGYSGISAFFKIILPQVIKRILPSMGNEFMTLVKDTALVQTIGVAEIFNLAQGMSSRTFSTAPIYVAGLFYLIMNGVVSGAFSFAEKKLDYYS